MHKLNRGSIEAPECLANYNHQMNTWSGLEASCKQQVREALKEMQGPSEYNLLCAYCENAIYHGGHIEHFLRKHKDYFPELMFEWSNLFLSCDEQGHCGHYKDRRGSEPYNPDELIKPDVDDPDTYLYFHSSGEVMARTCISPNDESKASETIRVFGLNNPALIGKRSNALRTYKARVLDDLQEFSTDLEFLKEYIQGEVDASEGQPFATVIKHFLGTYS